MTPDGNEDFLDVVAALSAEGCDFVVVGAHALAAHGAPRATGDRDVFVRPDPANAVRVFRALTRFGAPLAAHGVRADDFARPGNVVEDVVTGHLGPHAVRCIGLDAMIRNKLASGRTKDLADVEVLEHLRTRSRRRAPPT